MPYSYQSKQPKDRTFIFFLIFMGEKLSQPTKHANKIIILIFLIMKATILDTQVSAETFQLSLATQRPKRVFSL